MICFRATGFSYFRTVTVLSTTYHKLHSDTLILWWFRWMELHPSRLASEWRKRGIKVTEKCCERLLVPCSGLGSQVKRQSKQTAGDRIMRTETKWWVKLTPESKSYTQYFIGPHLSLTKSRIRCMTASISFCSFTKIIICVMLHSISTKVLPRWWDSGPTIPSSSPPWSFQSLVKCLCKKKNPLMEKPGYQEYLGHQLISFLGT